MKSVSLVVRALVGGKARPPRAAWEIFHLAARGYDLAIAGWREHCECERGSGLCLVS